MWIKHFGNGTKIVQGGEKTWLTTQLFGIMRVELVLPEEKFGKNSRFSLAGPGPYHHAYRAVAIVGGKPNITGEFIQRFNGIGWLTIEADYTTGKTRQYVLKDKI